MPTDTANTTLRTATHIELEMHSLHWVPEKTIVNYYIFNAIRIAVHNCYSTTPWKEKQPTASL